MQAAHPDIYDDMKSLRKGIIYLLNGWDPGELANHLGVDYDSVMDLREHLQGTFHPDICEREYNEFPVQPGDEVNLTIKSISDNADGVGYVKGGVVFVEDPTVEPGDTVRVRVLRVPDSFAIAELIKRYNGGRPDG